jgi:hypothetical protein
MRLNHANAFQKSNAQKLVHWRRWLISSTEYGAAWLGFEDLEEPASPLVTSLTVHWYRPV